MKSVERIKRADGAFPRPARRPDSQGVSSKSFPRLTFGHGHGGDHFHPQDPFEVYGTSNPFFWPMVKELFQATKERFNESAFAERWIFNPELDGLNNLRSLHLLLSNAGLEKTFDALPFRSRPEAFSLTVLKTGKLLCSIWPLKKVGEAIAKRYKTKKEEILGFLHQEIQTHQIFPMLYYSVLTSPKADRAIRAEAAKMLLWDYIAPYDPKKDAYAWQCNEPFTFFKPSETLYDQGRWGKVLMFALHNVIEYESGLPAEKSTLALLAKIFSSKAVAWPHDDYRESQAPSPSKNASHHHGSGMITIHRPEGWDAPQRLSKVLGEKLLVLPLSQPIRPVVKELLNEPSPPDWFEKLTASIRQWNIPGS